MGDRVVASYCTTFLKPEMLHIYRQVRSLQSYRTFVMTKWLQNQDRFPFDDVELIPQPHLNPLRHGWLKFVKRKAPIEYRGEYQLLSSLLEKRGADLMHIYFGHTGVHLLPFIERWNRPCVVSFHGADVAAKPEIRDYGKKLKSLFKAVPLVLSRSHSLNQRLISLGCPPEKLRLCRTGVPLRQFPFVKREAPVDGKWRLLQACRLIPKKGVATTLCAFAIFQKEFPKAELVIAGKGPLQAHLEELAEELGIAGKVHFHGFLTQGELLDLYASSHIFVHPSETPPDQNQEGIPNSVLEAMSTGLPVVATTHGGSRSSRASARRIARRGARFRSPRDVVEGNRPLAQCIPRDGIVSGASMWRRTLSRRRRSESRVVLYRGARGCRGSKARCAPGSGTCDGSLLRRRFPRNNAPNARHSGVRRKIGKVSCQTEKTRFGKRASTPCGECLTARHAPPGNIGYCLL
jgi:colanic acid/amylovoran biosynthesis glycosyltransferase